MTVGKDRGDPLPSSLFVVLRVIFDEYTIKFHF